MELSTARVLITGAARGIGNYIANDLLPAVEKVIVIDHNQELLDKLEGHPKLVKFMCDITDPAMVEAVITKIFNEEGGINTCINNAGIIHSEPLINILSRPDKKHKLSNWQKVIDVNLNA